MILDFSAKIILMIRFLENKLPIGFSKLLLIEKIEKINC